MKHPLEKAWFRFVPKCVRGLTPTALPIRLLKISSLFIFNYGNTQMLVVIYLCCDLCTSAREMESLNVSLSFPFP